MIMGEHAVLHGYPALVAALQARLWVTLTPLVSNELHIQSALGEWRASLTDLPHNPVDGHPLRFVFAAVQHFAALGQLPCGVQINIDSKIDATMGLGSSAALSVALVASLRRWLQMDHSYAVILDDAVSLIRRVQGRGSGADAAASCYGGLVSYDAQSRQAQTLLTDPGKDLPALRLIYTGYKTPTPEVIALVAKWAQAKPQIYAQIYQAMGEQVAVAEAAIVRADWLGLAAAINAYQQQMEALGVCDKGTQKAIDAAWRQLPSEPKQPVAVKISGSGLGDCILGLGVPEVVGWPHRQFAMQISPQGLQWQ
jgi:mevalonate kinase